MISSLQFRSEYPQKLILLVVFLIFTPITLVASLFALLSLSNVKHDNNIATNRLDSTPVRVLASSDTDFFPSISSNIVLADGRSEILRLYLSKIESELAPHADFLVSTADKYGLDFRLLPAIAIKESGSCRVIPPGSHNCWGWGIHSKGTLMFDSYEEAIETVSKGLKVNYIDKGYVTPEQIMEKYAHPDSTTWGPDVAGYMSTLE